VLGMFMRAARRASEFTCPFVGLRRRGEGHVYSTIGAFVVLNAEGWALTSAHLVNEILAVEREARGEARTVDETEPPCTDHAEIWAVPGFSSVRPHLAEVVVRPLADLALIRLEPFDAQPVSTYPTLRDSGEHPILQGTSVCRLGYPFHNIAVDWDDSVGEFRLPTQAFPVPSFALDGVVARFRRLTAEDGVSTATFIETSTPGLRGQSGGPLLDVEGRLCGIQSHTVHLDLGFDAQFAVCDQVVTERQFLNVGAATHVADVVSLLDETDVGYKLG
jgi:S1-C subfamily serine protease